MQTKQTITIRFATDKDTETIADFRIQQFKTAKEFEIKDLAAVAKQRGKVFIAEIDGTIISTMQIEVVNNSEEFKKIETAYIPSSFDDYKTIYLSKGASTKEFRNKGLNSLLRKITLNIALNDTEIKSLTGTAYDNAPRINLLKKLGYEIEEIQPDLSYAKPVGKELFLCLRQSNFLTAKQLLSSELAELESEYDILDNTNT
jgi:hypothetical protein